jgi:sterol desaturase/sphingolipid hydroxylase (fatty acid hydroxylase superfamily)
MTFTIPDLGDPGNFLLAVLVFFLIVVGRYFLIAGLFHFLFFVLAADKWKERRINKRSYPPAQLKKEIGWSLVSGLLFALAGALTLLIWQRGFTKVYTGINDRPLWWLPVSFFLALLLHETYYYWLHRWMHRPAVFRVVHKVHHDSHITSPWTAFSFHPLEGLLQAVFLPLLLLVIPIHLYVVIALLVVMSVSSVINHLNIEIYPANFHRARLAKWFIGATHHSLHHKQFKYNFGLYFTFWDKWTQTESPEYPKVAATDRELKRTSSHGKGRVALKK